MPTDVRRCRGYSLVEILTVIAIIAVLLAILLPSLVVARGNAVWASSRNNMRQIYTYMQMYWEDNSQFIPPSLFDYSGQPDPGKVRAASPAGSTVPMTEPRYNLGPNQGTWSDILWTYHKLGTVQMDSGDGYDYRFDSPDNAVYDSIPDYETVFRSAALNSPSSLPDATAANLPGYFAANNFFDSRPGIGRWITINEIRRPSQSMYLIDSLVGEVIEDEWAPYYQSGTPVGPVTMEVDFRYIGDSCQILFLDGNVGSQKRWKNLQDLETSRQVRVVDLDLRAPDPASLQP